MTLEIDPTIRYHEKIGLLLPPGRTPAGLLGRFNGVDHRRSLAPPRSSSTAPKRSRFQGAGRPLPFASTQTVTASLACLTGHSCSRQ
jgi:hypothetical protein